MATNLTKTYDQSIVTTLGGPVSPGASADVYLVDFFLRSGMMRVASRDVLVRSSLRYRDLVIADGATAYWPLNEQEQLGGTICTDVVAGLDAFAGGAARFGRPGAIYRDPDTSVGFNAATSDLIVAAGDPVLNTGIGQSFTYELWAFAPSPPGGSNQFSLVSRYGSDVGGVHIIDILYATTAGVPWFYLRGHDGTTVNVSSSIACCDGTWHHLMGVCDRALALGKLYVDGVLSVASSITTLEGLSLADPSSLLRIGNGAGAATAYHTGGIAHVAFYNRALTDLHAATHHAVGRYGWRQQYLPSEYRGV